MPTLQSRPALFLALNLPLQFIAAIVCGIVTVASAQSSATLTNIGSPTPTGSVAFGQNAITLRTTASGIGGGQDNLICYYYSRSRDFDIATQVSSFPLVTTSSPQLAGLMARASLAAGSQEVSALVEAPNAGNSWRTLARLADGNGSIGWPHSYAPGQVGYPNVWV